MSREGPARYRGGGGRGRERGPCTPRSKELFEHVAEKRAAFARANRYVPNREDDDHAVTSYIDACVRDIGMAGDRDGK